MNELFSLTWPLSGEVFSLVEGGDGDLGVVLDGMYIKLPKQAYGPLVREILEREPDADPRGNPAEGLDKPDPATQRSNPGIATDPFMVMKTALMDACPALAAIAPMEDIDQLAEAACAAYGRHQTGEAYGLPPYEPPTCGTGHLVAERTLRLLAKGTPFDALPSGDAIRELATLAEQAGVAFAREALVRDAKPHVDDEDLPF